MKLQNISQCNKGLNFKPLKEWPANLPPLIWKQFLIAGFSSPSLQAVELEHSLGRLLKDIYGRLSLPELARLQEKLKALSLWSEELWLEILAFQELRASKELQDALGWLSQLHANSQAWISQKNLGLKELHIIQCLKQEKPQDWLALADHAFNEIKEASRSDGAQALEWSLELVLQEATEIWPRPSESFRFWLSRLKGMRFPKTLNTDQIREKNVSQLSWPSHVQATWKRLGDEGRLELHLSLSSAQELQNQLQKLQELQPKIEDSVWKSH